MKLLWHPTRRSANVEEVAAEGGALLVKFRSGKTYRYPGAAGMLDDMLASPSAGEFVIRHLRGRDAERL